MPLTVTATGILGSNLDSKIVQRDESSSRFHRHLHFLAGTQPYNGLRSVPFTSFSLIHNYPTNLRCIVYVAERASPKIIKESIDDSKLFTGRPPLRSILRQLSYHSKEILLILPSPVPASSSSSFSPSSFCLLLLQVLGS